MAFLRRRKKLRFFLISLVVLGLLFGVYRIQLERLVKKSEDAYLALGYPLDLAELNDWYPAVPDEENAALLYVAASEQFNYDDGDNLPYFGNADELELGPPMSEDMHARMASFLDRNADIYEQLHKAASYPRSRYPIDLSDGHSVDLGHLAPARNNARLLGFESLYKSEIDDTEGAVQALIALFAVGRSLADEPIFLSLLVRSALDSLSIGALSEALDRTSFDDSQLTRLADAIGMSNRLVALRDILIIAYCSDYAEIKNWESTYIDDLRDDSDTIALLLYSELPWVGKTWLLTRKWAGANLHTRIRFLELMRNSIPHAKLPLSEAYEIYSTETYEGSLDWGVNFLANTNIHIWPLIIQTMQSNEARLSVAQTALAVERYRLSEGRLPYELLELVPKFLNDLPVDPFTGQPLLYLQLEEGYRVYSVGTNFVDEDGKNRSSGVHLGDDIGFER